MIFNGNLFRRSGNGLLHLCPCRIHLSENCTKELENKYDIVCPWDVFDINLKVISKI